MQPYVIQNLHEYYLSAKEINLSYFFKSTSAPIKPFPKFHWDLSTSSTHV